MLGLEMGRLPHELAESMLAAEEAAYMALYRDDPWGPHRMDLGFAQVCQILWNQNVKKDHRRKLTDFLPFYRRPKTTEEDPEIGSKLKSAFSRMLGK